MVGKMGRMDFRQKLRLQLVRGALTLIAAAFLTSCGEPENTGNTQVVARVNNREISVHQVLAVLQSRPDLAAEPDRLAARKVLESLIEQELAAQAGRELGLDKQPHTIRMAENLQREIVARAYQDSLVARVDAPATDEIDRYYSDNAGLFANRRLYVLEEFAVTANPSKLDLVKDLAAAAKTVDDLKSGLSAQGFPFRSRQFVQAAEDMPIGLLKPMSRLAVGQTMVVPDAGGARLFSVLYVRTSPIDLQVARPVIGAYLLAERKRRAIAESMGALRRAAKIDYSPDFAPKVQSAGEAAWPHGK